MISKGRLEAFSDGVLAIILTIMVLELKIPKGESLAALGPLVPVFLGYVLSFVYVSIYWNNHHHMLQTCRSVTGLVLWANLHLLFWLSLLPFATGWMGANPFATWPTVLYGIDLLMCAIAYFGLQQSIIAAQGPGSTLARAVGRDWKGKLSPLFYVVGITASFWSIGLAQGAYVVVAILWLVPDRRIERALQAA